MKVLHIMPTYYPATYWGGPIFSVMGLNRAIVQTRKIDLRVITTNSAGPGRGQNLKVSTTYPTWYKDGYEVTFCKRISGVAVSSELLFRLRGLVNWADLVHVTGVYSFPTIPALLLGRTNRKPLVWSPRGSLQATHEWPRARKRYLKSIWENVCNRIVQGQGCVLHVTSEEERVASLARIPNATARIIRNGVDIPTMAAVKEIQEEGRFRLLFLGRLDRKKGIENLLNSLKLLHDPTVTLNLYGCGIPDYRKQLENLAEKLNITTQVHFKGHLESHNKYIAFENADLCVVPSHSENFCMVVAEALAHGVPVIASTGTPWSGLNEKGCGEWVSNSSESLAAAIKRMRRCSLSEMGARGRAWMKRDFGWSAVGQEMVNLYDELVYTHQAGQDKKSGV